MGAEMGARGHFLNDLLLGFDFSYFRASHSSPEEQSAVWAGGPLQTLWRFDGLVRLHLKKKTFNV